MESVLNRALLAAVGAALAALVLPLPLRAHALDSSLERVAHLNRTLELQSRFSTGVPAAGAAVSLVAPGHEPIPLGTTDARGSLRFELPAVADSNWEVRVDQGPGHRDYLELPSASASVSPQVRSHPQSPLHWPGLLAWGAGTVVLVGALAPRPSRRSR